VLRDGRESLAEVVAEVAPAATNGASPASPTPSTSGPAVPETGTALAAGAEKANGRPAPAVPRTPDLWQMGSALLAVLLLGTAGVMLLRKLRGGAVPVRGSAPLMTLRQTLRLSARQAVHAIEFDDRILLIGEHERGLALLDGGRPIDRSDESELAGRRDSTHDPIEEEGAVPKNLVIPRPPRTTAPQRPTRAPAAAPIRNPGLNDFRALLQKVGRA
jgi:flagellar biogenesis protein FliO